jgi:hypothetical protein
MQRGDNLLMDKGRLFYYLPCLTMWRQITYCIWTVSHYFYMHLIFVVFLLLHFAIFLLFTIVFIINTCKLHQWCNGCRTDFECGRCMGNLIPDCIKPKTITLVFVASLLSTQHLKDKVWLALNQGNVFEWSDMFTCGLLFQWTKTTKNPTKHVNPVQSGHHYHLIEYKTLFIWH